MVECLMAVLVISVRYLVDDKVFGLGLYDGTDHHFVNENHYVQSPWKGTRCFVDLQTDSELHWVWEFVEMHANIVMMYSTLGTMHGILVLHVEGCWDDFKYGIW